MLATYFASDAGTEGLGVFVLLMLFVIAVAAYFLPTLIAISREHSNVSSIALCNFFFGWTFVGWVISLVWSFSDNTIRRQA